MSEISGSSDCCATCAARRAQDDHPCLKPGVIWYRVADETHNADGKFIEYLDESEENDLRFRECDESLYEALRDVVSAERLIKVLERKQLLPSALYSGRPVPQWKKEVSDTRSGWFAGALAETAHSNLVFLDPDNGIGRADMRPTQRKSCKHVLRREIPLLVERKPRRSFVIYQHLDLTRGTAEEKTERQLKCLWKELGLSLAEQPFGVLFHRGVCRAFLILPVQKHYATLLERTNSLVQKWGEDEWQTGKPRGHFTGPIF